MTLIDMERVRRALASAKADGALRSPGRHAAVASVLRDGQQGAEVLLIRRAEHPKDPWSGHMAFPGGRHDPTDLDLIATAQRETLEEVGLDLLGGAELIGRLEDTPAIARGRLQGLTIVPFVFEVRAPVLLRPNHEVSEALWVPLTPLAGGALNTVKPYRFEGRDLELPGWDVDGRIVWGLTHRMLSLLLESVAQVSST